jgi:hypothetical protein
MGLIGMGVLGVLGMNVFRGGPLDIRRDAPDEPFDRD